MKYYYVDEPGEARVSPISDELQLALDRVIKSMTSVAELPPLKVNLSGVRYSYSLWRYWMTREEESDFAATLGNNQVTFNYNWKNKVFVYYVIYQIIIFTNIYWANSLYVSYHLPYKHQAEIICIK